MRRIPPRRVFMVSKRASQDAGFYRAEGGQAEAAPSSADRRRGTAEPSCQNRASKSWVALSGSVPTRPGRWARRTRGVAANSAVLS